MSDAFTLIRTLGKDGKSAQEIARELHARGVTNESGKTINTEMVSGFLRFIGNEQASSYLPGMFGPIEGTWGAKREKTSMAHAGELVVKTKRRNRWNPARGLDDDLKTAVARLYQKEGKKVDEIARELGVHPRKIAAFCAALAGLDVPPGEVTFFIDESGREVTKCPPAFAHSAYPQRNVGAKGGY
jgi:hypothetical protein